MKKVKKFLKEFPKWFGLYLGIAGLITFNLFILEEAFQTALFSSWPAADDQEWRLVKRTIGVMEKLHTTLVWSNNIGGWVNPFAYVAYSGYAKSEELYIDALKAKVFANAPELFDGEIVTFSFKSNEMEPAKDHYIFKNGNVAVLSASDKIPEVITGKVKIVDYKVVIDTRR